MNHFLRDIHNKGEVADNIIFMLHTFLVVTGKMLKIGLYLAKLSQKMVSAFWSTLYVHFVHRVSVKTFTT